MSLIRTLSEMLKDKELCPESVECLYVGCSGQIKFTREGDKVIARCAGKPDRHCGYEVSMGASVLTIARRLWDRLGDIPTDGDECIEEPFYVDEEHPLAVFPVGTHREEIWHYFEETFGLSVAEDLMQIASREE